MSYMPTAPVSPVDYYHPPRRSHRWRIVGFVLIGWLALISLFLAAAIFMYVAGFSTPSRLAAPVVVPMSNTVPAWWSATAPPTTGFNWCLVPGAAGCPAR